MLGSEGVVFGKHGDSKPRLAFFVAAGEEKKGWQTMSTENNVVDTDKIIELCQKAIEENPKNATAHHDLGVALFQKQDVDGALEHLTTAAELAPQSVLTHYLLGIAKAEKVQLDEAITSWKRVLELDKPNKHKLNGMAHYFIGKVYGLKGMWDAAHMELRRAKKLLPGNPLVMNASAEVHLAKGELEEAKAEWLGVVTANPEDPRAAFNVCAIAIDTGDYQLAIDYGRRVITMGQDSGGVRFNLGIAYLRLGDYDAAVKELKKAVEFEPEDLNNRLTLGEAYIEKGLIDAGVQEWELAAKIHPTAAQPYYNIGLAYSRNGLLDQASEYWDKALQREPNYLPVFIAQGTAYALAERWNDSLEAWHQALQIEPKAELVRINAMAMNFRLGEYSAALELAEDLVEQPDVKLISSLCYLQLGATDRAWNALSDLHQAHPDVFKRHARLVKESIERSLLEAAPAQYEGVAQVLLELHNNELSANMDVADHPLNSPENKGWWNSLLKTLRK